jgi:integrase
VSYLDAVQAAFAWFEACAAQGDASEHAPRGRTDTLRFCPIGELYTVGHALHDYLAWSKIARSAGGHYNMITLINHHLSKGVTNVPLDQFTVEHLKSIALQIIRTPPRHGFSKRVAIVERDNLSPDELRKRKRTYNSIVGILKVSFSYAWDAGKIETDRPIRCLKRISVVHTPRLLFLNRNECRALLAKCTPALRNLVLAGLYSGCRVGELAQLRAEDVGHQIFGLRMAAFKRSPARFVFLPDEGMAFFLRMIEGKRPKDHVFLSDRGKIWRRQHTNLFRRAVEQANLPRDFVFHGLRHTYATDLLRQGVPIEVVARQLGHADIRTVADTYGHIAEQFREEQIRKRFSPLDEREVSSAQERAKQLEELWHDVRSCDWRTYAPSEPTSQTRPKSIVRTPLEVLQVFNAN